MSRKTEYVKLAYSQPKYLNRGLCIECAVYICRKSYSQLYAQLLSFEIYRQFNGSFNLSAIQSLHISYVIHFGNINSYIIDVTTAQNRKTYLKLIFSKKEFIKNICVDVRVLIIKKKSLIIFQILTGNNMFINTIGVL